ncbi:2-hydroxyacylsphingosine 1-beta-galactosyltransferase-like [Patiria miniata]|uniref:UDP-glucuronosyltransferase n=1 Tax=Patiria miniata TaxID=46514 RepID=A0A914ANK9_PATMI|nr:2-hydroxyacylsphingosine 1-beta-galactosyltransferase-like [Patiria miniata]
MTSPGITIHQLVILLVIFLLGGQCESTLTVQQTQLKLLYYTASDDGSHHLLNTKVAEALVRKGHDVTFLLSDSCTKWRNVSGAEMFKFAVHRSRYTVEEREQNIREISRLGLTGELRGFVKTFMYSIRQRFFSNAKTNKWLFDFHTNECDSLLGDNATIRALRKESFDLLIGDELSDCQPMLAEILGIKFVLVGQSIIPTKGSWYGIPNHPAYIPERQAGLTDTMNLPQRILNTCRYVINGLARRAVLWKYEDLQRKYNLSPEKRMPEMLAQAQLWLFYGDFGLEFARPLQPNTVMLASPMLGLSSDKKIPKDQQEFLDAADEGVVLFTLGSHVNEMETAQAQMFANGLAKLKQRVMWQFPGSLAHLHIGNNTKVVQWMLQQKILDHRNTKALLNHGGRCGMYEAAWYGLPMVGIPLFGDHFDNMERAVAKGMALQLDITTLTEDALYDTVTRVIEDPRYRERTQHISRLLRDDPVIPSEKAAHWIAHVGKYGGEHLRPRAADLSWIQYHLLDVYVSLAAILFGVLGVLLLGCKGFMWLACCNCRQQKIKVN